MRQIIQIFFVAMFVFAHAYNRLNPTKKPIKKPTFEDFEKKMTLSYHIKKTLDNKLSGKAVNYPKKTISNILDPTDELLNFDFERVVSAPASLNASRRYFQPPKGVISWNSHIMHDDYYNLRARIYELMKQTMYEARDALAPIQLLRKKYNKLAIYKMGYLFSKTDDQAKLFHQMAHKLNQASSYVRADRTWYYQIDLLVLNEFFERILNHWFETELLIDVIRVNDNSARKTLERMTDPSELETWFIDKFDDVFHVFKQSAKASQDKKKKKADDLLKKKASANGTTQTTNNPTKKSGK